jgi:chemotaxis protein CheX
MMDGEVGKYLGRLYGTVVSEVIATISGFELQVLAKEWDVDFEEMTGVMHLNGKKNGIIFVSISESHMRLLCSYMIGVELDKVEDGDVEDGLCELVNIIAGSAKIRLSDTEFFFNLSMPYILKGQNMTINAKTKKHFVSRILGSGEITIRVKVVY